MSSWPPLEPQQIVHRGYRNESDRDNRAGKPKPKVFYRRENERGLSVGLTVEAALGRISAKGRCELSVGEIRKFDSPLDAIQDEPDHANIEEVPLRIENEELALAIARYLARIAEDRPLPTCP